MTRTALIIAAGNGSRLRAATRTVPKPLVNVGGQPLLRQILSDAQSAGIRKAWIVLGYGADEIKTHFEKHPVPGIEIDWLYNEDYKRSNGLSVLKARDVLKEDFVLLMADHVFEAKTLRALLRQEPKPGESVLAIDRKLDAVADIDDACKVLTSNGSVTQIDKSLQSYNAVDTGMFLCTPGIFEALSSAVRDGDVLLADGVRELARRGKMKYLDIGDARWQDVDTPETLAVAEQLIDERRAPVTTHTNRLLLPNHGMSKAQEISIFASRFLRSRLLHRPRYINIEVTKICNARCGTCDYWQLQSPNELRDFSPVVNAVDPLGVSLAGGEPTLRKDLPRIIEKLRDNCPRITFIAMISHGGLLTREKASILRQAGLTNIGISLDYPGDEHDRERGIPGLFKHISEIVPQLPALGFKSVQVHCIISNRNLDHLIPLAELAKQWGVTQSFTTFSAAKVGPGNYWVPPERLGYLRERIAELIDYRKKNRHVNNSVEYLQRIPEFFSGAQITGCQAGVNWVHLTPQGFIKTCSEFDEALHWTEWGRRKKEVPRPDCTACWFKCRGENQTKLTPQRAYDYANMFVRQFLRS